MLALAMRFHDPVAGRVLVGGTDLRELRPTDVRALIAWSAQSPQIIGGTLASNLLLARTDLTDTDLEAALLRVELDLLLTTVGLHGWIGESGERLSAGERGAAWHRPRAAEHRPGGPAGRADRTSGRRARRPDPRPARRGAPDGTDRHPHRRAVRRAVAKASPSVDRAADRGPREPTYMNYRTFRAPDDTEPRS